MFASFKNAVESHWRPRVLGDVRRPPPRHAPSLAPVSSQKVPEPSNDPPSKPEPTSTPAVIPGVEVEYRRIPGTALVAKFEERQHVLTRRRREVVEKALGAEKRMECATAECKGHCDTIRQLGGELAQLPQIQKQVKSLKQQLEDVMGVCNFGTCVH